MAVGDEKYEAPEHLAPKRVSPALSENEGYIVKHLDRAEDIGLNKRQEALTKIASLLTRVSVKERNRLSEFLRRGQERDIPFRGSDHTLIAMNATREVSFKYGDRDVAVRLYLLGLPKAPDKVTDLKKGDRLSINARLIGGMFYFSLQDRLRLGQLSPGSPDLLLGDNCLVVLLFVDDLVFSVVPPMANGGAE